MRASRAGDAHAPLDVSAEDVALDRDQHDHSDRHQLVEGVDVVQVERVVDHADRERADERVADVSAAAGEAAPPMITAAIESSSERSPAVGEPASIRPAVSSPPMPAASPLSA